MQCNSINVVEESMMMSRSGHTPEMEMSRTPQTPNSESQHTNKHRSPVNYTLKINCKTWVQQHGSKITRICELLLGTC